MVRISKAFSFEASHILPLHGGKCSRLHGHSWKGSITVEGPVDPVSGFVVDYAKLGLLLELQIEDVCDHRHLGKGSARTWPEAPAEMPVVDSGCPFGVEFYPSSENLVAAFARILRPLVLEFPNGPQLVEVRLQETCTSEAVWRPDNGS